MKPMPGEIKGTVKVSDVVLELIYGMAQSYEEQLQLDRKMCLGREKLCSWIFDHNKQKS